jgi:putative ABC transport system permease protein
LTEIEALECRCGPDIDDPAAYIQSLAAKVVPEAVVIRRHAAAQARRLQRDLADAIVAVAPPVAAWVVLVLIGGMAWLNVRERRAECGILRALGWTRASVLGVLLGRWVIVGLLGGGLGLAVALVLLAPTSALWWWTLLGAPAAAVLAGCLPALIGASADPVEALRT